MITGIDVCSEDGAVAWDTVASAGHRFAYLKASESVGRVDSVFRPGWAQARASGLLRGAYHYARPLPWVDGGQEAAFFAETMDKVGAADVGNLPPAVTVGWSMGLEPVHLHEWMASFVGELYRLTGRRPLIYAGRTWKESFADLPDAWGCPLWLAQYDAVPELPPQWRTWTLWQYNRATPLPGRPDVRLATSRFDGSVEQLKQLADSYVPVGRR